jgi:hypothetical protein
VKWNPKTVINPLLLQPPLMQKAIHSELMSASGPPRSVGADVRNAPLERAKIRNLVPASTSVPAAASYAPHHRKGNPVRADR